MFFRNKNNNIKISNDDKIWVELEMLKLFMVFNTDFKDITQYLFTKEYFKETYKNKEITPDNLIIDLCNLFSIDYAKINYEVIFDIRDLEQVHYFIKGDIFEARAISIDDGYKIYIANDTLKNAGRLIYNLVYEFSKIKLIDTGYIKTIKTKTRYDTFIAVVYFGFGLFLSNKLIDVGTKNSGFWTVRWRYYTNFPEPVLAYLLAIMEIIGDNKNIEDKLPESLKEEYDKCLIYLNKNGAELIDLQQVKNFNSIGKNPELLIRKDKLSGIRKTISTFINNVAYHFIKLNELDKSLELLKKAFQIDPDSKYINNNLAYIYIRKNKLDLGKKYLDRVISEGNILKAYYNRNKALYYVKLNRLDMAKEYFDKAFSYKDIKVDMLDEHYAEYLAKKRLKE